MSYESSFPPILALDTSGSSTDVALLAQGRLREAHALGGPEASRHLLRLVTEVLDVSGLVLGHLGAIAYGAGPGAFTGIRTAAAVALGLAVSIGCPVVPVGTLEALAHDAQSAASTRVVTLMDARMGEIYAAIYARRPDGGLDCLLEPFVAAPGVAIEVLGANLPDGWRDVLVVGAHRLIAVWPEGVVMGSSASVSATAIAELAAVKLASGAAFPAEQAQPVYVRNKVAQTLAERAAAQ
ncbi:tRNA (adenosine(37)-N6)-threonylcarbamoyltransferase complex dimerization subunit type 1 TsaB [Derxia gummosa]|uniref:tRNA (Adenosine(37)-N6)-threonylcarbamoyltransferase complex dimerization subunit type 1 TsaB n=1 Tax=Derxia gummosa DSM 723 TaxID=1121388 RepID=A0A8B6X467_9BURK|nr:tRNA (adenosine(37)-N6)-threonylcarbamoyltransferase complex dimerization subunit type 1 TsaB [Derxia gummosa]